ncbi:MAG: hypothetical protein NZO58_02840, partial [Gemmataceae bacterium]|nr:hypothetical protein [Gemmataceae bacterium]
MIRGLGIGMLGTLVILPWAGAVGDDPNREALQALQEFIGGWKGSGTNAKTNDIWKESIDWSWRFKGKDAWLTATFTGSKLFKSAEIRWLADKGKYQLTLIDKQDKKAVFVGELKKDVLQLERINPETKDTETIKMKTVAQGIRSVYDIWVRPE